MSITVVESKLGRSMTSKDASRLYLIQGAFTEWEARTALLSAPTTTIPAALGGLIRSSPDFDVEEVGPGFFHGTAKWVSPNLVSLAGSKSFSFDSTGQTSHITNSLGNVHASWASGAFDRDTKGAINVSSDGSVGGADIIVPQTSFQIEITLDAGDFTQEYIKTVSYLVGKVNDSAYLGYQPGELLLAKASGSQKDYERATMQFGFMVSENGQAEIEGLTPIDKYGWELLWVYYTDKESTTTPKYMMKVPTEMYTEQVYHYVDFDGLNIPPDVAPPTS